MITTNDSEFLWVEKYRPKTIEDCVLPDKLKSTLLDFVKGGQLPNLMFSGTAGLGKTTCARAICDTLDLDYIVINGSEESGIDVLRNKIRQFASSMSLSGGYKVVILDECDYLQSTSTQPALRNFIEEFSANCRFILTCNFKNRIIKPLHSRCSVIEFDTNRADLARLSGLFMGRLCKILTNENVKYDKATVAELIKKYAPDWRRVINECQRFSSSGELSPEVLVSAGSAAIQELVRLLKTKDFKGMRAWVAENATLDTSVIFRAVYDGLNEYAKPQSIPSIVLILNDYSYKAAFVADRELNLVACFTELMGNSEWN